MKYSILALALMASVMVSQVSTAANLQNITPNQEKILNQAYQIAESDGHSDPELLQAIVYQESKAGLFTEGPGNCLGVSQLNFATAKAVIREHPELIEGVLTTKSDKELRSKLKNNPFFNMRVASKYLLMVVQFGKNTNEFKAAAYNRGPGAVGSQPSKFGYVKSIKALLIQFKNKHILAVKESAEQVVAQQEDVSQQKDVIAASVPTSSLVTNDVIGATPQM